MIITWNIAKKRGNYRPVLTYVVTLSEFERALCLPCVCIESTIPKPPESSWTYCWPGRNERGIWSPTSWYPLRTPSHKDGSSTTSLKLPWREENMYPEVEESFAFLRQAFEQAVTQALGSAPMDVRGNLETSAVLRQAMAPAFAARRILQAVSR